MTREEAINWLKAISFVSDHHITEAIDMAIEALKREAERQEMTIRASERHLGLVRCKDCYHAEDDITHMYCVYFGHKVYDDDYCSNAVERKEKSEVEE